MKFVTKCQRITEQIDESTVDIDYQFMTEEDMKAENFSACPLAFAVHAYARVLGRRSLPSRRSVRRTRR